MNSRFAGVLPLGLLLLVTLFAGGCSLKKAYPAKQSYLLEARRAGEPRAVPAPAVLRVRPFQIAPPFESRGFVRRTSDLGYQADFYHEFLVAPRALLAEQTRQWLAASGLFRLVIDPASKTDATHSLEATVSALYGDYRDSSVPKAVLAMEFFLSDDQPAAPQIVFHKVYRQEITLDSRAPEALAQGWSRALERILAALENDLATLTR